MQCVQFSMKWLKSPKRLLKLHRQTAMFHHMHGFLKQGMLVVDLAETKRLRTRFNAQIDGSLQFAQERDPKRWRTMLQQKGREGK